MYMFLQNNIYHSPCSKWVLNVCRVIVLHTSTYTMLHINYISTKLGKTNQCLYSSGHLALFFFLFSELQNSNPRSFCSFLDKILVSYLLENKSWLTINMTQPSWRLFRSFLSRITCSTWFPNDFAHFEYSVYTQQKRYWCKSSTIIRT